MGFYGKGLGIASDADLPPGVAQSGFGTRMYVADQTSYDTVVDVLRSYYQQEYEGVNFGVIQNNTPIVPTRIRADRTPIPNERGRIDVSGGISLQGQIDTLLPFWKHSFMEVGDGHIYLLNTDADVNKFAARNEIDAQHQYSWTPGYATERYNHATNARTAYAAGTLALRTAAVPSPTFHATDGREVSASLDHQPNDNTFGTKGIADNTPVRIEITLSTAVTAAANKDQVITIIGKDQNGTILRERHVVDLSNTGITDDGEMSGQTGQRTLRSIYYYQSIETDGIKLAGFATATGTVGVTGRNYKKVTRFVPRTNLTDGMTLYIIKGGIPGEDGQVGGIPNVYVGCLVNTMNFAFGETITMDMEFIGRNGYPRVTPATIGRYGENFGKTHIPPDAAKGGSATVNPRTDWDFAGGQNETYLGWEGGIQIREIGSTTWETVPCTDMGFSINNNLTHPERYWFRRYHVKPIPSDQMELMVDATVDYKTAQGYDFLQAENLDIEARAVAFYRTTGGDEYFTKIDLGRAQINQAVDPSVGGPDVITQTFNLKASSKDKNSADIYEAHPVIVDICSHTHITDLRAA